MSVTCNKTIDYGKPGTNIIKDYTEEEKAAYFGAMATMASVDGNASPEEIEFLKMMAEAAELPENIHQEIKARS